MCSNILLLNASIFLTSAEIWTKTIECFELLSGILCLSLFLPPGTNRGTINYIKAIGIVLLHSPGTYCECAAFVCKRLNFLQNSLLGAVFWICDQNSADNMPNYELICELNMKDISAAHNHHTSDQAGDAKRLGGEQARTAQLTWPKGYSIPSGVMLSKNSVVRRRKGRVGYICNCSICLSKSPVHVMKPCLPGDGWTFAFPWKVLKEVLVWLCLHAQVFLYLWNWVFSLLLFWFSPPSLLWGVSEWLSEN